MPNQLTLDERITITDLRHQDLGPTEIGRRIGRRGPSPFRASFRACVRIGSCKSWRRVHAGARNRQRDEYATMESRCAMATMKWLLFPAVACVRPPRPPRLRVRNALSFSAPRNPKNREVLQPTAQLSTRKKPIDDRSSRSCSASTWASLAAAWVCCWRSSWLARQKRQPRVSRWKAT